MRQFVYLTRVDGSIPCFRSALLSFCSFFLKRSIRHSLQRLSWFDTIFFPACWVLRRRIRYLTLSIPPNGRQAATLPLTTTNQLLKTLHPQLTHRVLLLNDRLNSQFWVHLHESSVRRKLRILRELRHRRLHTCLFLAFLEGLQPLLKTLCLSGRSQTRKQVRGDVDVGPEIKRHSSPHAKNPGLKVANIFPNLS